MAMLNILKKCVQFSFYTNIYRSFSRKLLLNSSGKMQTAFVYMNDGEDYLKLSFPYRDAVINKKEMIFQRPTNEPLETTFGRVMLKITGLHEKKDKRKKRKNTECSVGVKPDSLPMKIVSEGLEICSHTLNSDAWKSNSLFILGNSAYKINVNPPTVLSIKLPTEIMAGLPVIPYVQLKHASIENSSFVWYKSEMCVEDKDRTGKDSNKTKTDYSNVNWIPITTGYVYNAKNDDVGHLLRVVCYPKLKDEEIECVSDEAIGKTPIGAGPDSCPYHSRQEFTKGKSDDKRYACRDCSLSCASWLDERLNAFQLLKLTYFLRNNERKRYTICSHCLIQSSRFLVASSDLLNMSSRLICFF